MKGKVLLYASEIMQGDLKSVSFSKLRRPTHTKKGALLLIQQNPDNLKRLTPRLKNNKTVVLSSIDRNPRTFKYAGEKAKNELDVASFAVERYPQNVKEVGNKLRASKDYRDLVKLALSKNGKLLKDFPEYQNDEEMVDIAVTNNSSALEFANERFKKNPSFIYKHASERSFTLLNADKSLIKNRNFIKKVVSENPVTLNILPMYQNDIEIVEIAILSEPTALKFAGLEARANKALREFVVSHDLEGAMPYLISKEELERLKNKRKDKKVNSEKEETEKE